MGFGLFSWFGFFLGGWVGVFCLFLSEVAVN